MVVSDLMKSLNGLLNEEQAVAFSAKLEMLVEDKVIERVDSVLEEEREEMQKSLAQKADKFVTAEVSRQVAGAKADFDKIIEENKNNFDDSVAEKVKTVESEMVKKMDTLMEESISMAIPEDIQHEIAVARNFAPIIAGVQSLFEEHLVPIDADATSQIAKLNDKVENLEEQLNVETESRISLSRESELTKKQLLVEQKCGHLTETHKARVLSLFEEHSFSQLEERIDNTIDMLEENQAYIPESVSIENNDADIAPNKVMGSEDINESDAVIQESIGAHNNINAQRMNESSSSFGDMLDGIL